MHQLKELTVLVHPGYLIQSLPVDPQELVTLRLIEGRLKKLRHAKHRALLVLMYLTTEQIAQARADRCDREYMPVTMVDRLQLILGRKCAQIHGAEKVDLVRCMDYLEQARTALEAGGYSINSRTTIRGVGEMQGRCVPHVVTNFAALTGAKIAEVLLDYTPAAHPFFRGEWITGGRLLENAKKRWPAVSFVPLGTHKGALEAYEDA
ncbi:hypothetical protein HZA45_00575 [Candidatus Peregrinibacteria bacterium]|nr:hypothetical protein [Candidatus Peregrinibacteria bacterium]